MKKITSAALLALKLTWVAALAFTLTGAAVQTFFQCRLFCSQGFKILFQLFQFLLFLVCELLLLRLRFSRLIPGCFLCCLFLRGFLFGSRLRTLSGFIFLYEFPVFAVCSDKVLYDTVSAEDEQMVHQLVKEMPVV